MHQKASSPIKATTLLWLVPRLWRMEPWGALWSVDNPRNVEVPEGNRYTVDHYLYMRTQTPTTAKGTCWTPRITYNWYISAISAFYFNFFRDRSIMIDQRYQYQCRPYPNPETGTIERNSSPRGYNNGTVARSQTRIKSVTWQLRICSRV